MNINQTFYAIRFDGEIFQVNLLDYLNDDFINNPWRFLDSFGLEHDIRKISTDILGWGSYYTYSDTEKSFFVVKQGPFRSMVSQYKYVLRTVFGDRVDPEHVISTYLNNHWERYKAKRFKKMKSNHYRRGAWSGFRSVHTLNEMKQSFRVKEDGEPEVRGARKASQLPDAYWDISVTGQKCWKKQRKVKKQWMRN